MKATKIIYAWMHSHCTRIQKRVEQNWKIAMHSHIHGSIASTTRTKHKIQSRRVVSTISYLTDLSNSTEHRASVSGLCGYPLVYPQKKLFKISVDFQLFKTNLLETVQPRVMHSHHRQPLCFTAWWRVQFALNLMLNLRISALQTSCTTLVLASSYHCLTNGIEMQALTS